MENNHQKENGCPFWVTGWKQIDDEFVEVVARFGGFDGKLYVKTTLSVEAARELDLRIGSQLTLYFS